MEEKSLADALNLERGEHLEKVVWVFSDYEICETWSTLGNRCMGRNLHPQAPDLETLGLFLLMNTKAFSGSSFCPTATYFSLACCSVLLLRDSSLML